MSASVNDARNVVRRTQELIEQTGSCCAILTSTESTADECRKYEESSSSPLWVGLST
jgi:hypothetical protein